MPGNDAAPQEGEEPAVVATVQTGDGTAFASLAERHRNELRVHCYRMLGNFEDAEDLVQETFARAWRNRAGFEGRSTFRAWLYRIATNACLDAIKSKRRRVRVVEVAPSADPSPSYDEVPWLQPFPDHLIAEAVDAGSEPDALVVAKETIELAFLAAVQHLPPRPPRRDHSARRARMDRERDRRSARRQRGGGQQRPAAGSGAMEGAGPTRPARVVAGRSRDRRRASARAALHESMRARMPRP